MKELFVSTNDWDSHRELLYVALENTVGSILEYGSGDGSTHLLREYAKMAGREFVSLESNKEWAEKTGATYIDEDYTCNEFGQSLYSELVFIDAAPASARHFLIRVHANKAKVLVVHDTEPGADYVYGMKEALSSFKYRFDYKPDAKPHTTAVSNFIDVSKWEI